MARQYGKSQGRQVGSKEQQARRALTDEQQVLLGALVSYCVSRDTAVFVGSITTTGSIKLNIYPPDDKCVGALNLRENWLEALPGLLSDVFEEDITLATLERAVPWLRRTAADAPAPADPPRRVGTGLAKAPEGS